MLFRNDKKDNRDASPNEQVALLPLRELIVFPHEVYPIFVGRQKSIKALETAEAQKKPILLAAQKDARVSEPGPDDIYSVGTLGVVVQLLRLPDGTVKALLEGKRRARILRYVPEDEFFKVEVEEIEEVCERTTEVEALMRSVNTTFDNYVRLNKKIPPEMVTSIAAVDDPAYLADKLVGHLGIKLEDKQSLLECTNAAERLERILGYMRSELEILEVEKRIRSRVKKQMEKTQKEYYLNEQMRAIQKELGEKDEFKNEIQELEDKLRQKKMPAEAREKCEREIKKLKMMSPMSAEATVVRNYLDWFLALPWFEYTEYKLDIKEAERILEEDHYGLEKVKQRILEYLAVQTLVGQLKGPILCLVGPPGVGKTSLGQSIAKAMGLKFGRVSLGGVHDEAEIRGHRRTYIGSLPGNIVQAIRKAGTRNPVLMLDEVDKLSASYQGDPFSALLEVLDPEQNNTFRDNYLGVPFDLSKVLFIGTANVLDSIPAPLRDRMEIIELAGYTEEEKLQIARRYLLPRQLSANGLTAEQVQVSDEALRRVIADYTRESGVRSLERQIGALLRNAAVSIASGRAASVSIDTADVATILGAPRFENDVALRTSVPGVATGLAWTPAGGDILFIESSRVKGSGKLILTGQLGDVMKESAQAAVTLVKSQADRLGIDPAVLDNCDLHIHVPAGAIPKDGPSAGVAIATSLASLLSQRTVRPDVAMTGEISLRGVVLPVGGIKEKCVAAARAGIRTVILPARNRRDLEDIPESVRNRLEFVWAEKIADVLSRALGDAPARRAAA
jgi:ATP-dependent Lon protease